MYELVLNFREVYLKYFLNYPVAAYRIDDEVSKNPQFKDFVEVGSSPRYLSRFRRPESNLPLWVHLAMRAAS